MLKEQWTIKSNKRKHASQTVQSYSGILTTTVQSRFGFLKGHCYVFDRDPEEEENSTHSQLATATISFPRILSKERVPCAVLHFLETEPRIVSNFQLFLEGNEHNSCTERLRCLTFLITAKGSTASACY